MRVQVLKADDCIGEEVKEKTQALKNGEVRCPVAMVSKPEVALFEASHELSSRRSWSLKTSVSTRRRQRMTPGLLRRYLDLFGYTRRTNPGCFQIAYGVGPCLRKASLHNLHSDYNLHVCSLQQMLTFLSTMLLAQPTERTPQQRV